MVLLAGSTRHQMLFYKCRCSCYSRLSDFGTFLKQKRFLAAFYQKTKHRLNILYPKGFYDEVSSPLLSEVNFIYPDNTVNSLTGSHFKQLFNGSEIVVAGRLNDIEMNDFPVEVSAQGVRDLNPH